MARAAWLLVPLDQAAGPAAVSLSPLDCSVRRRGGREEESSRASRPRGGPDGQTNPGPWLAPIRPRPRGSFCEADRSRVESRCRRDPVTFSSGLVKPPWKGLDFSCPALGLDLGHNLDLGLIHMPVMHTG